MPFVLDQFFASVGRTMLDRLILHPVSPACHYRWTDGSRLNLPFASADVPNAIDAIAPGEGINVVRYLNQAREVYELTKDVFILRPFSGVRELLRWKNLPLLPKLHKLRSTRTMHTHHMRMFNDKRIIQLFDRFATYNGSSPYLAPATLMVIPWVEIGLGAWYPDGGIYSIARAITDVAREVGVNIHLETPVKSIVSERGHASGVVLQDGSTARADIVVSNADVHVTRRFLLGKNVPNPTNLSCSGLVIHMSVHREEHGLQHHNVLFTDDYPSEFEALKNNDRPHKNATIYVSRPTHTYPDLAPSDRENWFVLVNAPARGVSSILEPREVSVWRDGAERNVEQVVNRMSEFGLRPSICATSVRTPDTMASEWSSFRGALYGSSSNSMFSAFLRPKHRSRDLPNLWYVGGSVHPGGGVPLTVLSGMMAADQILSTISQ